MRKQPEGESQELNLGPYIRQKRIEHGFNTLSELTRKSGVSEATLSRIESGLQPHPSPSSLNLLAIALEADQDALYILSGYWPPSLKRDPAILEQLLRLDQGYFVKHKSVLEIRPSSPSHLISQANLPGTLLRKLRGELSQKRFAQVAGLSQSHISELETERSPLSPRLLRSIAERVGKPN